MDEGVVGELTRARQRLLDLTLRNRLLNFRPTRRTTVEIVDELPGEVWRLLVEEGRKLSFLAREEHELFCPAAETAAADAPAADEAAATASGEDEREPAEHMFALPAVETALEEGQSLPERYTDLFLQTSLPGEELQTNLVRIQRQARSILEERGVNLLFLATGFLTWRTEDEPDRALRAPLVLVPAAIVRASAGRRFKIAALDDEPVLNPCLRRKMQDLRIELPAEPGSWGQFAIADYLEAVGRGVADLPGWSVGGRMFLGFFSFVKYLMYVDLDSSRWPADRPLAARPLIRAVCGDRSALPPPPELPPRQRLDEFQRPEDVFQVLDADSSQQEAILAAKSGANLVIEGPPGTGKSQTIANVIAECLAAGRTVLFVSEKLAALEVVKRRLDAVGLGDFCLELHSTKANRRAVAAELGRVLEKGPYRAARPGEGPERLRSLIAALNDYVAALHAPIEPAGTTPQEAMGRVALLADVPDVLCGLGDWPQWRAADVEAHKEQLSRLGRQMRTVGPVGDNPWRGARLTAATMQTRRRAEQLCGGLREALGAAAAGGQRVAGLLGAAAPQALEAMRAAAEAAALVLDSPGPADRLLTSELWDDPPAELKALLGTLDRFVEARRWMAGRYRPETLDVADWPAVHERCRRYWASITRWFRPTYWSDRRVLIACREDDDRADFVTRAAELKQLAEAQRLKGALEAAEAPATEGFGDAWRGPASDWEALQRLGGWLGQFRRLVGAGRIGPGGVELAAAGADRSQLADAAGELNGALERWGRLWGELAELLVLEDPGVFADPAERVPQTELADRLGAMAAQTEGLFDWARYQEILQQCRSGPLAEFVAGASERDIAPETLALAMEKQYFRLCAEAALAEREALRGFNATDHDADVLEFARRDRQWVRQTCYRLHGRLAEGRPGGADRAAKSSQLGILRGEVRRKRGGRPIRRLLTDADDAIQKLKPCFMMSPLSVAQFLAPEGMRFDVVVFDEASQVEPADALGAVARGEQLILVGDPKQLPPTTFFDAVAGEADRGGDGAAASLADMESILDRGTMVLPIRRLRWHYRSRHDSLIAFSNREFYGGELVAFPSCHAETSQMGLSMVYEPGDLYARGRSQTNRAQARRVGGWVFDYAREHPDASLGVGAFSRRQQQAILDEIEKLRRADCSLEAFFDPNRAEPFFVKNLETIQGDERDVILLSVGYGRGEEGERVSMNFGPLNREGGWRRLNVLVTRARRRCVVFTSIVGEDFDLSATQARGVHALKAYLDYARSGAAGEAAGADGAGQAASAIERAVYNALTAGGVELHRRVGRAGYTVDLAVVDEQDPGRYCLGIECDGPTYRDAATARDRDRTRRQVLEGLGWRIHRVWAPQWFRSPRRELERALEAVRRARAGQLRPVLLEAVEACDAPDAEDAEVGPAFAAVNGALAVPDYHEYRSRSAKSNEEFYTDPPAELAKLAARIVEAEGPVHRAELTRRIYGVYGFSRGGRQIAARIDRGVCAAVASERIVLRGDFFWPKGMDSPPVRRRREESARDVELICDEEIARAAMLVLEAQFGMGRADLVTQIARLLGFQHAGARIEQRVDAVIESQLQPGAIVADESGVLSVSR